MKKKTGKNPERVFTDIKSIKKWLRHCGTGGGGGCSMCGYHDRVDSMWCRQTLCTDTLALIQDLEKQLQLSKEKLAQRSEDHTATAPGAGTHGATVALPCAIGETIYAQCEINECVVPFVVNTAVVFQSTSGIGIQFNALWTEDNTLMEDLDFTPEDIGTFVFLDEKDALSALAAPGDERRPRPEQS